MRTDRGIEAPRRPVCEREQRFLARCRRRSKQGYTAVCNGVRRSGAPSPFTSTLLHRVPAVQVIAHRIAWSLVFVLVWMYSRGELGLLRAALFNRGVVLRLASSALLISLNWLAFVYGVTHGRVVETSLGYFIGPLVNVLLGVVVLSERLTPAQWISVGLATLGVGYLTYITGGLPWIALTMAVSFSCYGLVRKVVKIEALPGLAMETLILTPLAFGYLVWCEANGVGAFGHTDAMDQLAVDLQRPADGIHTLFVRVLGTPPHLFNRGLASVHRARRCNSRPACSSCTSLSTTSRLIGFVVIWAALIMYAGEGLRLSRRQQARTVTA